jgi:membrane associated rhomboid family serine protease/Tfp pilus assembly protein PilF
VPSPATCLRCGKEYDAAHGGDPLLCNECAATQPRVSVTLALIAINVLVFIGMVTGGASPLEPTTTDLLKWGASFGPRELTTEWWRLFTAMFVHIGVLHILLNMYCLWRLGPLAERLFGPWRFLSLYLLSGVAGSVASVALHPMTVAAGASGAIFGVAGALVPVLHLRAIPAIVNLRGRGGRLGIGGFIVYNLVYGFANTGIDNAAHIGGLAMGFVIGYATPVVGSHSSRQDVLRTGSVLLATALFLTAAFLGVRHWRQGYGEMELGRRALLAGNTEEAIERLQGVVYDDPVNGQAHLLLGAAYLDQRSYKNAADEFEKALLLRRDSSDVFLLENLGVAYLNINRPADAVPVLEKAVSLQPDTVRNRYNLGLAYLGAKQLRAALVSFQEALRLKPDYPKALLQRGSTYQALGKLDSARADYERVEAEPAGAVSDELRKEAGRLLATLAGH